MGKVNQLHVGMAVTVSKAEDFEPSAMDIDDCIARITENKWKDIIVNKLLALVDQPHAELVAAFQWLCILVHYVPEFSKYKPMVSELYWTKGAKKKKNPH